VFLAAGVAVSAAVASTAPAAATEGREATSVDVALTILERLDASPARFRFDCGADAVLFGALQDVAGDATPPGDATGGADGGSVSSWSMSGEDADDDSLAVPEVLPRFGEAGSVRLDIRGGYGADLDEDSQWIALGGIGLTGFIEDGLAIRVELNGAQIQQDEGSEQGLNAALLVEWHFLRRETWSLYFDGGAGVLFTTGDVPATGSSFNFTPQAGVGLTADFIDESRFVLGVKWFHISNANTFSRNPGRDFIEVYAGLSFPF
jgi:hypothetical protein